MSVEEYSLKFIMLSRFSPSFVSNPRNEISWFLTGVTNLLKEECHTGKLHNDMRLSRLMVFAEYIEEYNLKRITRNMNRGKVKEQNHLRFKKMAPI